MNYTPAPANGMSNALSLMSNIMVNKLVEHSSKTPEQRELERLMASNMKIQIAGQGIELYNQYFPDDTDAERQAVRDSFKSDLFDKKK